MPISSTSHSASQADGKCHTRACGEVHVKLARGPLSFSLQAVVVSDLDCDMLAGVPFMRDNDIQLDIPCNCIIIQGKHKIPYNTGPTSQREVRHTHSFLFRSPTHETRSRVISLKSKPLMSFQTLLT